jgi:hypothetical protein
VTGQLVLAHLSGVQSGWLRRRREKRFPTAEALRQTASPVGERRRTLPVVRSRCELDRVEAPQIVLQALARRSSRRAEDAVPMVVTPTRRTDMDSHHGPEEEGRGAGRAPVGQRTAKRTSYVACRDGWLAHSTTSFGRARPLRLLAVIGQPVDAQRCQRRGVQDEGSPPPATAWHRRDNHGSCRSQVRDARPGIHRRIRTPRLIRSSDGRTPGQWKERLPCELKVTASTVTSSAACRGERSLTAWSKPNAEIARVRTGDIRAGERLRGCSLRIHFRQGAARTVTHVRRSRALGRRVCAAVLCVHCGLE